MKRKLFSMALLLLAIGVAMAQSIRKNYNEMTPSERLAYKTALTGMKPVMQQLGCLHSYHFSGGAGPNVHNGEFFFPWHRWFQHIFETKLKSAGTANAQFLTVPYWDWRVEYNTSQLTWNNSNFIGDFNTLWQLGRNSLSGNLYGGTAGTQVAANLALPGGTANNFYLNFSGFSGNMESLHGTPHGWVGGIMGGGFSPYDPIFFMHHGFMDKIWQEWEDSRPSSTQTNTVFTSNSIPHVHGTSSNQCSITGGAITTPIPVTNYIQTPHFDPNGVIDARKQDFNEDGIVDNETWYAYNKKLLLDGLGGDFQCSGTKKYCYVAWNPSTSTIDGIIYTGDLKRNSSDNVIADNKGGFKIVSGSNVSMSAGKAIVFSPGFMAANGSTFVASIVNAPCGFASNTQLREGDAEESEDIVNIVSPSDASARSYPNPISSGNLNFGRTVSIYMLMNSTGAVLQQGSNSDKLDVTGLSKGMYILKLDDKLEKVIIE